MKRHYIIKHMDKFLSVDVKFTDICDRKIEYVNFESIKWMKDFPETIYSANEIIISCVVLPNNLNEARLMLNGGDANYEYKVSLEANLNDNHVLSEEVYIKICED